MNCILSCKDIYKEIKCGESTHTILNGVSLTINEGEFVSIMGESGAGKSSLLYILGLMDNDNKGDITIDNKKVKGLKEQELSLIRRESLGFVFQTYNLIPSMNALDNILLPAFIQTNKKIKYGKREKARELLRMIGLSEKSNEMITSLSGGEQQRIAIARALINEPKLILMDEPTGNLDSKNGRMVMELIKEINEKKHVTFLQVTHSIEYANYGNRILYMSDGEIYKEINRTTV